MPQQQLVPSGPAAVPMATWAPGILGRPLTPHTHHVALGQILHPLGMGCPRLPAAPWNGPQPELDAVPAYLLLLGDTSLSPLFPIAARGYQSREQGLLALQSLGAPVLHAASPLFQVGAGSTPIPWLPQDVPPADTVGELTGFGTAAPATPLRHNAGDRWASLRVVRAAVSHGAARLVAETAWRPRGNAGRVTARAAAAQLRAAPRRPECARRPPRPAYRGRCGQEERQRQDPRRSVRGHRGA